MCNFTHTETRTCTVLIYNLLNYRKKEHRQISITDASYRRRALQSTRIGVILRTKFYTLLLVTSAPLGLERETFNDNRRRFILTGNSSSRNDK